MNELFLHSVKKSSLLKQKPDFYVCKERILMRKLVNNAFWGFTELSVKFLLSGVPSSHSFGHSGMVVRSTVVVKATGSGVFWTHGRKSRRNFGLGMNWSPKSNLLIVSKRNNTVDFVVYGVIITLLGSNKEHGK